jgi:two-component system chemotaxis response regulator CheY
LIIDNVYVNIISNLFLGQNVSCTYINITAKNWKGGKIIMAKVLIVDDASFMRMTIRKMLEAHGHSVAAEAENGIEAVKKFIEYKPDVVLLDITMPEMNGVEALKRIKELDPNARVVICSAMGQQAMVAQAIQYGAKDFIVKPFEEDRLIAAVDKIMNR